MTKRCTNKAWGGGFHVTVNTLSVYQYSSEAFSQKFRTVDLWLPRVSWAWWIEISDLQKAYHSFSRSHVPCRQAYFNPSVIAFSGSQNAKKSFSRSHLPWRRWFSKSAGISFSGCHNAKKSFTRTHITLSRDSQNPSGIPFSSHQR